MILHIYIIQLLYLCLMSPFVRSKLGLIAATRVLAREHPRMRINACCPGYCDTARQGFCPGEGETTKQAGKRFYGVIYGVIYGYSMS